MHATTRTVTRLRSLLQSAFVGNDNLAQLLADKKSGTLEGWLRDEFFAEHCQIFLQRPFVWHIWDGLRRLWASEIGDELVRDNERMLTDGFYAEVSLSYDGIVAQENNGRPFRIDSLRPIQMSKSDVVDVLAAGRETFTTEEWKAHPFHWFGTRCAR